MKARAATRFFLVLLLILVTLAIPDYYRIRAKPYRLTKSNIAIPSRPEWDTPITFEKKSEILSILSQRFVYLGKGIQSYAFLSDDGNYVLKLFLLEPCQLNYGRRLLDSFKNQFGMRTRQIRSFGGAEAVFNASKIAYDHLREETGLVYVHLNLDPAGLPAIEIKDFLGFSHSIDPRKTRFVLQKKADKIFPALKRALQEDRESFYRMIRSFSSLLSSFQERGVSPDDSKMPSNFGYIGERAIQIDFASNSFNLENSALQTEKFRSKLRAWLQLNAPDALQYLDD